MTLTQTLPSGAEIHNSWIYFHSSIFLYNIMCNYSQGQFLNLPAVTQRGICVNFGNADDTSTM